MEINLKRIIGIAYIIAGFVWCILNLPNLIARAKGNAIIATTLAVIRILFWPVFALLLIKGKSKTSTEGNTDEDTKATADWFES